jgi:predicted nucleic acid-binding protein
MPDRAFIYAFAEADRRQQIALDLPMAGGMIGVQTLNEFANVVTGKFKTPWPDAPTWLNTIRELCPPAISVTLNVHHQALRIAQAYGYHIYDALMLAAALEASCTVFYSDAV